MRLFILFFWVFTWQLHSLGAGIASFEFNFKLDKAYSIKVFSYKPRVFDRQNTRVLFDIHGVTRKADGTPAEWQYLAEHYNLLVIAPQFDKEQFPNRMFHGGNVFSKNKKLLPENQWTYSAIEQLFDFVKKKTRVKADQYYLFGSSAGGQFVHRFMLLTSENRVKMAVAANSGYYTMDFEQHGFPYDLKGLNLGMQHMERVYKRNVVIFLGERDNDPNSKYLPRGKIIDLQGPHRLARGMTFYDRLLNNSMARLVRPSWRLHFEPQAPHGGWRVIYGAAQVMFNDGRAPLAAIGPLVKTNWDRYRKYARYAGVDKLRGYAVHFGQVFHYYSQCPKEGCRGFSYEDMPAQLSLKSTDRQLENVARLLARVQRDISSRRKAAEAFNFNYAQYTTPRSSKQKIESVIEANIRAKRPLVLNVRSKKKRYMQFIIDGMARKNGELYVHLNSRSGMFDGWYAFWQTIDEYDDGDYRRVIELVKK